MREEHDRLLDRRALERPPQVRTAAAQVVHAAQPEAAAAARDPAAAVPQDLDPAVLEHALPEARVVGGVVLVVARHREAAERRLEQGEAFAQQVGLVLEQVDQVTAQADQVRRLARHLLAHGEPVGLAEVVARVHVGEEGDAQAVEAPAAARELDARAGDLAGARESGRDRAARDPAVAGRGRGPRARARARPRGPSAGARARAASRSAIHPPVVVHVLDRRGSSWEAPASRGPSTLR